MKKIVYIVQIAIFFLVVGVANAQQEPNYSFYRYNMNVINPAYAGANGTELTFNFRSQWQGVQDAPETQSFAFSTGIGSNIGLGLSVINDQTFVEKQTGVNVDFSYKLQIASGTDLYLGLKAGINSFDINTRGLEVLEANQVVVGVNSADPALADITDWKPNVGIGAYLKNDKYFVALSAPRILNSKRVDNDNGIVSSATDRMHMYLTGGYNFDLSSNIEFKPSAMLRYVKGAPLSTDITAAFNFFNRFEIAANYRFDNAIGGMALINASDWLDFGYAYENSTKNEISGISRGTHEVFVRFNFAK